ncbi:hypothetical protein I6N96_19230 [Enterococcus sp. BWM-S5]|uniref:Uncharacterized protein n=1 Tax=Enterococcus larvae TaxID=2794352 RepID=A0ABS4CPI1_9ENTE|nr:hypothetical protein [Enterococcus larvae]MBP1048418.1 hypothetical protein [Enterococcus larvae]
MKLEPGCPDCGNELMTEIEGGRTFVVSCTSCSWSAVTSYFSPIEQDNTLYHVYLEKNRILTSEQIRTTAKISPKSYLDIGRAVTDKEFLIFEGNAIEAQQIKRILEEQKIAFFIVPEFDY